MSPPPTLRQASALAIALNGLDAHLVRVEVDCARGLPCFNLVGLPEACVRESRTRVRAALRQLGVEVNEHAVTVNLAPADLRKSGSGFDLAVACAILAALGAIPGERLANVALMGELSLTGELNAIRGVLPVLLGAQRLRVDRAIVPRGNAAEARVHGALDVRVASSLRAVVDHLRGGDLDRALDVIPSTPVSAPLSVDFGDVCGQHAARRALEIAAAGQHNVLMIGPPGTGKTMLARRLPSILPPMTPSEALEVTAIHSVAGLLDARHGLLQDRPFRAPHHTLSAAALLGGGALVRPGEVSLAHQGCLFLDELLEFHRHVIDGLRQPLEDGRVTIARARQTATFPARPLVVAAVNPCPCGYHGSTGPRACHCGIEKVRRYRARLSGPILDRIDLHVGLAPVPLAALRGEAVGEGSAAIRGRVVAARARQAERHRERRTSSPYNAELSGADLDRVARIDAHSMQLIDRTMRTLGLSARAYVRIRRVARTVADLDGSDAVRVEHVAEAIGSRALDRAPDAMPIAS